MSEATSKKLSKSTEDESRIRSRTRAAKSETAFADIQENTFFQVVFADSLSLEEKSTA